MHLERFGSLDEIVRAKSELAAGAAAGRHRWWSTPTAPARCGSRKALDRLPRAAVRRNRRPRISTTRLEQSPVLEAGHHVRAADRATARYTCFTPLLGRPIILNLAGAFTLAVGARRRSGGRGGGAADAEAGVEPPRGGRGARRHLDSRRLQLQPVRVPRGARSGGGAAGGAAVPGDARRHRARAASSSTSTGRCRAKRPRSATTRSSSSDTNREAFVAGHRDAGREDAAGRGGQSRPTRSAGCARRCRTATS